MPRVAKSGTNDRSGTPDGPQNPQNPDANVESSQPTGSVLVEIPIGPHPPTAFGMHLTLNLSSEVATVLRRVAAAYDEQKARTKSGQRIVNCTAALRKILEDLAAAAG